MGKLIEENEIENISKLNDKDFSIYIKEKFNQRRKERLELITSDQMEELEKRIFLQLIDQNWKLHIQYLESLRQVIGLRSYGQRDPLVEYKKEAFNLFENLLKKLKTDLITLLFNLKIVNEDEKKDLSENNKKKFQEIAKKKVGRNEPCTCGSGKKYKHCCGSL